MIRLCVCVVVLGGTIAFLSCNANNGTPNGGPHTDGGNPVKGGHSGIAGMDGGAPIGGSFGGPPSDGKGPIGGRGMVWMDGGGPVASGGGGAGGYSHTDGFGPIGGSSGGAHSDGAGPIGGRGGAGGHGEIGGRGGAGGAAQPCDGLAYFEERGLCAPTYGVQSGKIVGICTNVMAYVVICEGSKEWYTQYKTVGDPLSCFYDAAGTLVAARLCTDTTMPAWNCNHAPQSPTCLSAGTVPDTVNCSRFGLCATHSDGAGPIGGHGGL